MDWLGNLMAEIEKETQENAPKLAKELARLEPKLAKLEKELIKWQNKVYKSNNTTYYNQDEIPVTTYGQINERRKARRISLIQQDIEMVKKEIEEVKIELG